MADKVSSKAEQVAGQILSIARREGFAPGARLIEQRLADALGVSRGPVRADLRALATTGIVKGERNRGFVLTNSPMSRSAATALGASDRAERTYRKIANDRLEGRLPEIVTEAELMRRYEPARAVMLRLLDRIAGEGWIARLPGNGWRFAEVFSSREACQQAGAFRSVIEPAALSEPGYRLAADVVDRLKRQQRHMLDQGLDALTMGEIFHSGCAFHEELIRGAGNPFYLESLKRVNSIRRLIAYRTYADREGMRRHIREHVRLLELIETGRQAEAVRLLVRHLRHPLRQDAG